MNNVVSVFDIGASQMTSFFPKKLGIVGTIGTRCLNCVSLLPRREHMEKSFAAFENEFIEPDFSCREHREHHSRYSSPGIDTDISLDVCVAS